MRLTPVGTKRDKFHGSGGGSAGSAATSDTRDHNSSPINHSKHGHLLTNCDLIGTNMRPGTLSTGGEIFFQCNICYRGLHTRSIFAGLRMNDWAQHGRNTYKEKKEPKKKEKMWSLIKKYFTAYFVSGMKTRNVLQEVICSRCFLFEAKNRWT